MSAEQNKAAIRRYFEEVWNKGNMNAVDEVVDTNLVDHSAPPGLPPGSEGHKVFVGVFRTAFPDLTITVEDLLADGDKVIARFTSRGTHQGDFMGIPATGKQITVTGISIDRFEGDKYVESWVQFDQLTMMQQLGVIPTPG
jgi:steroid delta-isomerase-like uncharacterized protein